MAMLEMLPGEFRAECLECESSIECQSSEIMKLWAHRHFESTAHARIVLESKLKVLVNYTVH